MVRVPERDRNKCERVTGPQPERVRSIFAGVNATRTSGTGPERDRNANRNRCEHGLRLCGFVRPSARACGTSLVRWMALQCANRTASRLAKRTGSLLYVRCCHRSAKSTAISNKTFLFQVTHIYLFCGSVTLST